MDKNTLIKIDKQYPGYSNALIKYGLYPKVFMSLKEFWERAGASKLINDANRGNLDSIERNTYFCIGFSNICREKIHSIIKLISDSSSIKWFHT